MTEVIGERIDEGTQVATGIVQPQTAAAPTGFFPFGGRAPGFGGPGFGGGYGGNRGFGGAGGAGGGGGQRGGGASQGNRR